MASRNMGAYEEMDKIPSSTLKRHPKMDLNKNDLLRLLSYLEGELQARDISIATLKSEKAKQLLYQAKYGRFGLGDPFLALQRDSDNHRDNSFDEQAVKAMYDNQLIQLENLIATQRKAQQRMREQLAAVEKRYHKVCAELEEEKQKHAQDTAQGDDVTYMLEKDRERLKQELDFEKSQNKKHEKDVKKITTSLEEESTMSTKHKQVALVLIKERKHYMEKLAILKHQNTYMESVLNEDKSKMKTMVEGLAQEGHKSLLMEAALEKQLSEFDIEREQLKGRLSREEKRNADLLTQIESLKLQLEQTQFGTIVRGSSIQQPQNTNTGQNSLFKSLVSDKHPENIKLPFDVIHNCLDTNSVATHQPKLAVTDLSSKHTPIDNINNETALSTTKDKTGMVEKPIPAEKPVDLNSSRINVISSVSAGSTQPLTSSSGNTTVFTTPSGTRISLNVGPGVSGSRKSNSPGGAGRGVPPPLPPNKPQVYLPSSITSGTRRDMVRPAGDGIILPLSPNVDTASQQIPFEMQKLGITISKDKITISNPHSSNHDANSTNLNSTRQVSLPHVSSSSGGGEGSIKSSGGPKSAQVCLKY